MAQHRIRKGLDLPLAGAPEQVIAGSAASRRVALVTADHPGLKPSLRVQVGDFVLRGQPLLTDKRNPEVPFTAPAAGTVSAINRGERRALRSVVIEVSADDGPSSQVEFAGRGNADRMAVRALLVESGLWTALRTRPFGRIPSPDGVPAALFVTAIDTQPHAPSPRLVLAERADDFNAGLHALEHLTDGPVFLCVGADLPWTSPGSRVRVETFEGPHPAGNVGLHIHRLFPVDGRRTVWHIGYQDVVAAGHLLRTGRLDVGRLVALSGPGVVRPRLLRSRLGASLMELVAGELKDGEQRVISGSVLAGRTVTGDNDAFLGRYHLQVSVLPQMPPRRLFAGLRLGRNLFSATRAFASSLLPRRPFAMTTSSHGPKRPMVPAVAYDRVMPFDIEPVLLLRALLGGDVEEVERLGGLELDEEDLALATVICPGKHDYGALLRESLDRLQEIAG
jgi:Na+-transporting NADH:ubiquinone oxidoreductase subunit A